MAASNALSLGSLFVELGLKTEGFNATLGQTERDIDNRFGNIKRASATMAVGLGVAFAGAAVGLGGITKAALEFESEINKLGVISGATETEVQGLADLAKKLGADTVFSAGQAALAMTELSKGGAEVQEIMAGAALSTIDLASAGEIDLPRAAQVVADAMSMFDLGAEALEGVVNNIAGIANATTTNVDQFAAAMSQGGGAAATAGLEFTDLALALGALAENGLKGADAGTSLKTMFINLMPSTKDATTAMETLGIISDDGRNKFIDAQGSIVGFESIAGTLQTAIEDLTESERIYLLKQAFGTDAFRAAMAAAKTGAEGVRKLREQIEGTTAADVAAGKMKGLKGGLEQLKGSGETLAISLGEVLLPKLTEWAEQATAITNWFNGLPDATKKAIVEVGVGSALALGVGALAAGMTNMGLALLPLVNATGIALGIEGGLLGGFAIALGAAALVIGTGAALVVGAKELGEYLGTLSTKLEPLNDENNNLGLAQFYSRTKDAKDAVLDFSTAMGILVDEAFGDKTDIPPEAERPVRVSQKDVEAATEALDFRKKILKDMASPTGPESEFRETLGRLGVAWGEQVTSVDGAKLSTELFKIEQDLARTAMLKLDTEIGTHRSRLAELEPDLYSASIATGDLGQHMLDVKANMDEQRLAFGPLATAYENHLAGGDGIKMSHERAWVSARDLVDKEGELSRAIIQLGMDTVGQMRFQEDDAIQKQNLIDLTDHLVANAEKYMQNRHVEPGDDTFEDVLARVPKAAREATTEVGKLQAAVEGVLGSAFETAIPNLFGEAFAGIVTGQETFKGTWTLFTDGLKTTLRNALSDMSSAFASEFLTPIGAQLGAMATQAFGLGQAAKGTGAGAGSGAGAGAGAGGGTGAARAGAAALGALPTVAIVGVGVWAALVVAALAAEGNDWRATGKTIPWSSLPNDVQRMFNPNGERISAADSRTMRVLVLAHKRSSWRYALSVSFAAGATRNGDLTAYVETANRIFHEGSAHRIQPTALALRLMEEGLLTASVIGLPEFWSEIARGMLRVVQGSDGVLATMTNAEAMARDTFPDLTQAELDVYLPIFAQSGPNAAAQAVIAFRPQQEAAIVSAQNAAADAALNQSQADHYEKSQQSQASTVRDKQLRAKDLFSQFLKGAAAVRFENILDETGEGMIDEADEITMRELATLGSQFNSLAADAGLSSADLSNLTTDGNTNARLLGQITGSDAQARQAAVTLNVNVDTLISSEESLRTLVRTMADIGRQEGLFA